MRRRDIRGKRLLESGAKYYVVDTGIRRALLGARVVDIGHVLENIVYLELLRRGGQIYVGSSDATEIDFVVESEHGPTFVQVAARVDDPATLERELAPLRAIHDFTSRLLTGARSPPDTRRYPAYGHPRMAHAHKQLRLRLASTLPDAPDQERPLPSKRTFCSLASVPHPSDDPKDDYDRPDYGSNDASVDQPNQEPRAKRKECPEDDPNNRPHASSDAASPISGEAKVNAATNGGSRSGPKDERSNERTGRINNQINGSNAKEEKTAPTINPKPMPAQISPTSPARIHPPITAPRIPQMTMPPMPS